jgi:hypothetical protein
MLSDRLGIHFFSREGWSESGRILSLIAPLTRRFTYGLPPWFPKAPAAYVLLSLRERVG